MSQVTNYTIPGSPLNMVELADTLADLFAAAVSANRGTTSPPNPFEGMFWWDNSSNPEILKRYTVAAGWVSLLSVNITTGIMAISGYIANSLYGANTILAATGAGLPAPLVVNEQRLLGRVTGGNIAALSAAEVATILGSSVPPWAFLSDVQTAGTNGGGATAKTWMNRTLNTIVGSSGYSSWITLSASVMKFAVGTYFIEAATPGYQVGEHKAAIKNISTSTYAIIGTSERAAGSYAHVTQSQVKGLLTVTDANHEYRLQQYTEVTQNLNGLGYPTGTTAGVNEIYSTLKVTKYS